jgi:S1-C subfamily serine protease
MRAALAALALLACAGEANASCQARLGQAGAALALSAEGGGFSAQVVSPRWTLPAGRQVGTLLAFDDRAALSGTARVAAPGVLRLDLAEPASFADALRRAQRLGIYAGGVRVAIALDGAAAALAQLAVCGDGAWRAAPAANAFLDGEGAALPEGGTRATRAAPASARWPDLQRQLAPMPSASIAGSPFAADQVHRRINDSVYIVWVDRGVDDRWTNLGSAVAISTDTLLTNCHVVGESRRLALRQAERSATPTLLMGDERTDRCFIRVDGMNLAPIAGVRTIESLTVGEPVYSLGNPGGRERVFGAGAILAVERREGLTVVRTSAPMSPGSSGGGLFDGYGNLVGITSFRLLDKYGTVLGRYAIAAEEFWR